MAKNAESESTALILVENPKLQELAEKSGVELSKAEMYVKVFHPSLQTVSELSRPLSDLDKINPTPNDASIARQNRLALVKVRTGAESIKDDCKKVLLAETNLIQSAYNLVKDACIVTENEYEEIEKFQEKQEKLRQENLFTKRAEELSQYEADYEFLPLGIWDEETYQSKLSKSKESFEAVKAQRAKAEADRIEAERLAEEKRIADEKAEKERIEAQAIENEKLRKEAEAREKELAKERAESEKKAKEQDAVLQKEREAREKVEAELRLKQEQEEKEKQQAIAEQIEREAAAKAKLLAPDKEKVNALFIAIRDLYIPDFSTEEAAKIGTEVREGLKIILTGITNAAKTLK